MSVAYYHSSTPAQDHPAYWSLPNAAEYSIAPDLPDQRNIQKAYCLRVSPESCWQRYYRITPCYRLYSMSRSRDRWWLVLEKLPVPADMCHPRGLTYARYTSSSAQATTRTLSCQTTKRPCAWRAIQQEDCRLETPLGINNSKILGKLFAKDRDKPRQHNTITAKPGEREGVFAVGGREICVGSSPWRWSHPSVSSWLSQGDLRRAENRQTLVRD